MLKVQKSAVIIIAVLVAALSVTCIQQRLPDPPRAEIQTRSNSLHGETWLDDYYWLRERDNPKVIEYLQAENDYAEALMKHTRPLQERLYREFVSRIKETDLSVPEKKGNYYYYSRDEKGKQYPIKCRKKGSLDSPEEIMLDENILAEGHEYLDVGRLEVSDDENILAYSVDTNGSELYTIYFKNLTTGEILPDRIVDVYYSFKWANDNKTVFYVTQDEARRPFKLFRHSLGTDQSDDELLYHEEDEAFELYISKSKSKRYLFLTLESNTTSEVHYLEANRPEGSFRVIDPRRHMREYSVYHQGGKFFILTNDNAPNFKLMVAPTGTPGSKTWREFITHSDSVKIDYASAFKDYLVVYERRGGLKQMRVIDRKSSETHYVEFPEPVYTFWASANPEYDTELLRFTYTSMITPKTVFDYDMSDRSRELKKEQEIPGGYDKALYTTERVFATASDGTKIPISLVYPRSVARDSSNPALLSGYGAYGSSSEPYFSSNRLSFLDRGFVCAVAHVRGGGEMGRYWYDQGKLLNKRNTFTDFIACAEHLVDQGYTSPEHLAISGGSAGGLLIGAVVNMRPDLFGAVKASVPFVDIINTMLDESIPLTVIEWEEWGNPNDEVYFDYMMSYSPYDNVTAQDYPPMLVTAGLNDARVQYWEPAKWTARLRANKTDNNLLILKTEMGAGHFGASGRYDALKDEAFEVAFILDALGIER